MTTANELITRGLRLINVPGRGADLAPEDLSSAFEALQELLDSEAVSKAFVPGIRRHFFLLNSTQGIYSYGAGAAFDFDSSDFGLTLADPPPIKIETAYVRQGSTITNYELVDEYRFGNVGTWVLTGGATIANNLLACELAVGTATIATPGVDLTGATTYTLRMAIDVAAGAPVVTLRNNAIAFSSYPLDSSGTYQFDIVWPAGTLPTIVVTAAVTDDFTMTELSLIKRGKPRLELPDGVGTDYGCRIWDQRAYNDQSAKGSGAAIGGGRVFGLLYSRSGNQVGEIRLDQPGTAGDILVMDVLVNTVQVTSPTDTLQINPEAVRWLRYALADNVSGEYGKSLNSRQLKILDDAWNMLAAGNRRINTLGVDAALRRRARWNINSGETR